jgi:hypothetical protein
MSNSWSKCNDGSWGIRVPDPSSRLLFGTIVTVTRRDGEESRIAVGHVDHEADDATVYRRIVSCPACRKQHCGPMFVDHPGLCDRCLREQLVIEREIRLAQWAAEDERRRQEIRSRAREQELEDWEDRIPQDPDQIPSKF